MDASKRRRRVAREWLQVVFGLFVFAFGVHLTIFANIGLSPWDCFGMGVSYHTPLNYGLSMTVTAVAILLIDIAMGERIGFGTFLDAFLTGNYVQLFNDLNPLPLNENVGVGVALMLVGLVVMALGMWVYMAAGQCCGPRDSLFVGIGRRFPSVPIGVFQIATLAVALLMGWLLGGKVGIGTIVSTFGTGLVTQLVYNAIRFEPRDVVHRDVLEVIRELSGDDAPVLGGDESAKTYHGRRQH